MRSWVFMALLGAGVAALATGPAIAANTVTPAQTRASFAGPSVRQPPASFGGFPFMVGGPVAILPRGEEVQPLLVMDGNPPEAPNAAPAHPRVETTPEGVTIVRGTGSRHR